MPVMAAERVVPTTSWPRAALAYWFEPLPVEPRGLEHRHDDGEGVQVGLDDEADDPFGRLLRRWEFLTSELTPTSDEIDAVEQFDPPTDDDRDPLGDLVRRAAAILDLGRSGGWTAST